MQTHSSDTSTYYSILRDIASNKLFKVAYSCDELVTTRPQESNLVTDESPQAVVSKQVTPSNPCIVSCMVYVYVQHLSVSVREAAVYKFPIFTS